jgi:hypothetical protein
MFNSTAGNLVDRVTQRWVQFTGVPIDLQTHSWLHGRIGGPKGIGKEYFNELAQEQGRVARLFPVWCLHAVVTHPFALFCEGWDRECRCLIRNVAQCRESQRHFP